MSQRPEKPVDLETKAFRQEAYESYPSALGRIPTGSGVETNHYARRLVRQQFPPIRSARIVDLGCGDGALLASAAQLGYENLAGVDLAAEHVAAAHGRGLGGVVQGNAFSYLENTATGTVDLVLTMDVVEHLTRGEALLLAREIHRVLAPSGRWVVHTPNGASPLFGRVRYGDLTHETAYTTSSMAQLFRLAGFAEFRSHEDTPVVHGLVSAFRALGWLCIRAALRIILAIETGNTGRAEVFSQNLLAVAVKAGGRGTHGETR